MAKSLCRVIFALMIVMYSANVKGKGIHIVEHPSSQLLIVNEIGDFSCRATCGCDKRCLGQWIINNETIHLDAEHSMWTSKGFIFPESNNESQDVLRLSVNASITNNNSVIQCEYMPLSSGYNSLTNNCHGMRSRTASVLVISKNIELSSSAINTSVLFKDDGIPALVIVYFQLPEVLCSSQQILSFIHYSLRVEDTLGSLVMHAGPFSNLSLCTIKRMVEPDLKETESYTLMVVVGTQSQNITSYKHFFNTSFTDRAPKTSNIQNDTSLIDRAPKTCNIQNGTNSVFSYQLIVIFSLGFVVILLFTVLVTVLLCVCVTHKRRMREKKVTNTKNKLCKSMVHNPLYDRSGPEYEIIPPRLESSTPFTQPGMDEFSTTHPANQHYDTINTAESSSRQDTPTADAFHYVDPPLHRLSKFRNASLSSNAHTHQSYDVISGSTSSSVPAASSLMGLKKNGRERNKLHLTLSLGRQADPTVGSTTAGNNHKAMASDANDNYTVLNPITLC